MSIFGKIKDAIFGKAEAAPAPAEDPAKVAARRKQQQAKKSRASSNVPY